MSAPIHYTLALLDPAAHLVEVTCTVPDPDPAGQDFALPAWIPGSYLIRDFARQIVHIEARSGGRRVPLTKRDSHTWRAAPTRRAAPLTVRCTVYCHDLSVRGAHVDPGHAFLNGTSVFLRPLGREARACTLDLAPPAHAAGWRVATTLPEDGAPRHGFGRYRAADYDELIDHPIEMGNFTLATFTAGGVPHEVAISGRHDCDSARLCADLARVCQWQIDLFGAPPPFARYLFLVSALGDGYGGLEHRASTALLCARHDLPGAAMREAGDGYRSFLGLCSHEYFHAWNVKRIRPAALTPYDLQRPNHTTLLWAFEGFTSYYDDLALCRAGVIGHADYLALLARTIRNVAQTPGRFRQTLAESSFDAWTRFYKPDENTPNAGVSYYAKGALVALALDLTLRRRSGGRTRLDDVMRALWQRYGLTGAGVPEDGIRTIAEEVSGLDLGSFFRTAVHGTRDLPLAPLLAAFGVRLTQAASGTAPGLGVKTAADGNELRLAHVFTGGAAHRAGLSAGDVLVALDGLRVTPASLDRLLERRRPGETVTVSAFRRDELIACPLVLDPPPADQITLRATRGRHPARDAWLGGTAHPD